MSSKKIQIGGKPSSKPTPNADAWVDNSEVKDSEPIKRMSIDVPESLHRAIKMGCASRGTKIADEIRELLAQKYRKQ